MMINLKAENKLTGETGAACVGHQGKEEHEPDN
jgi:hypothetical protein